jgi:integrase
VKRRAAAVGLDAARLAGHSLRAGLVTTAVRAGKAERVIMQHTGHSSHQMLRRYIRELGVFEDNAATGVGL